MSDELETLYCKDLAAAKLNWELGANCLEESDLAAAREHFLASQQLSLASFRSVPGAVNKVLHPPSCQPHTPTEVDKCAHNALAPG